jgi:hypothetical protein
MPDWEGEFIISGGGAEPEVYLDQGTDCGPPMAPSQASESSLSQASCGNGAADRPESGTRGFAECPSNQLPGTADKVSRENSAVGLYGVVVRQVRQYAPKIDKMRRTLTPALTIQMVRSAKWIREPKLGSAGT